MGQRPVHTTPNAPSYESARSTENESNANESHRTNANFSAIKKANIPTTNAIIPKPILNHSAYAIPKSDLRNEVIYINARSIIKNYAPIQLLITQYEPKVLICSEARICDSLCKSEYAIDNYNEIACFSENRSTGGVIIYVQKPIKYKMIVNQVIDKMIWFLAIEVLNSNENGIYIGFYRSPSKNIDIDNALDSLDELLNISLNLNKKNIVAGDLNIDML